MSKVTLKINGQSVSIDIPSDMPLLWALRDKLNLVGTKYSCGVGVCGSCTVLVNGVPMRSCVTPATSMASVEITTIEGLDPTGEHPVQKAWNDEDVPQCGYCQAGQVLTASALLKQNRRACCAAAVPTTASARPSKRPQGTRPRQEVNHEPCQTNSFHGSAVFPEGFLARVWRTDHRLRPVQIGRGKRTQE
jgi:isoquinoline 1-oxidoreductase alpha subunit